MIVVDMATAQAIRRGTRTALIRRSLTPYTQLRQPIVVLRPAGDTDPPLDRERQLKTPDVPVIRDVQATIDITSQERFKLGELTAEQVKLATYPNLREFRHDWGDPDDSYALPQYAVLLVTFELKRQDVAPVRLLGRDGQYTASPALAIHEAGEAVDEFTQARLADEARTNDTLRHAKRRESYEQRTTEERLRLAKAEAAARKVDISHHERVIADRVDRIERQLGKDKAA